MPTVPIYSEQRRTARRPGQAVTGNPAGGVRVAIGSIAPALEQPTGDNRGLMAMAQAGANMGRAIGQVGDALGQIALERMQAQNEIDIAAADMRMDEHAAAFEKTKLESDPRDWETKWAEHMQGFNPLDDRMSPAAREAASARFELFQGRAAITVARDATKQTFADAKNLFATRAQIAARNGDVAAVEALFAKHGIYFNQGEKEGMVDFATRTKKNLDEEAVYEGNAAAIVEDADEWLRENEGNPYGLPSKTFDALESKAYQRQRINQSKTAADFADAMATGSIKTEKDIESALAGQRPAVIKKAVDDWRQFQNSKAKEYNSSLEGILRNSGNLMAMVDDFDAHAPDAFQDRIRMEYLIKMLMPEGYRDNLLSRLDAKFNPPRIPTNPTLANWGGDQIAAWFKDGRFGDITRPVVAGEEGYIPPKFEHKWNPFKPTKEIPQTQTETVPDPAKRDEAMSKRAEVEMQWMDWLKSNPNASMLDAKKQLGAIMGDKLKKGDIDALLKSPVPVAPRAGRTAADVLKRFQKTSAEGPVRQRYTEPTLPDEIDLPLGDRTTENEPDLLLFPLPPSLETE